jgi:hypothetical protein
MRKIRIWVDTGFCNATHEDIFEFKDDTTDEEIEDEARTFLFNSIEYGWEDYEEDEQCQINR